MNSRTLLLISGSTRRNSINSAVLATAQMSLPQSWDADVYDGLASLPQFNPDLEDPQPPAPVRQLRHRIHAADAVLISTPEYAGTMPGALKTLLEWTIGDTVMSSTTVGWINPSAAPGRAAGTYEALATVLSYTGTHIAANACRDIAVFKRELRDDGTIDDPATRDAIADATYALVSAANSEKPDE